MIKKLLTLLLIIIASVISHAQDLQVIQINADTSKTWYQFEPFYAEVTIVNTGLVAVSEFNVTQFYFSVDAHLDKSSDEYFGFASFNYLAPNDTITLTLTGGAAQYGIPIPYILQWVSFCCSRQ